MMRQDKPSSATPTECRIFLQHVIENQPALSSAQRLSDLALKLHGLEQKKFTKGGKYA